MRCVFAFISAVLCFQVARASGNFRTPPPEARARLLRLLASEMTRLDGAALTVRSNRPENWDATLRRLEAEAKIAQSPFQLWRVFRQLDATYPNLHSSVEPGSELRAVLPGRITPGVSFFIVDSLASPRQFKVNKVRVPMSGPSAPAVGDEVVAINGRLLSVWLDENFLFCDWPLRSQCDLELFRSLQDEILSWSRDQPLKYTLRREDREWTVVIPIEDRHQSEPGSEDCRNYPARYPGFSLSYVGLRTCIYESTARPDVAVMRIMSFRYQGLSASAPIQSPDAEVDALLPFWRARAHWQKLIIDVIDNRGGSDTIPYYQILLQGPYQEQYAQFRKTPELTNNELRNAMFWGSTAQELWFQRILWDGTFGSIRDGDFLPPVPMFCPDSNRPCDEGLFHPTNHPFRGEIALLTNRYCVSSCDGFVYTLKQQLAEHVRLFGEVQSGDAAYTRLTLGLITDPKAPDGYAVRVRPIRTEAPSGTLVSQTIAVTRNLAPDGTILDGAPLFVDGNVPVRFGEDWDRSVFLMALDTQ